MTSKLIFTLAGLLVATTAHAQISHLVCVATPDGHRGVFFDLEDRKSVV